DIGNVRRSLVVADSIVLAGRTRQVTKVMVYRPEWLNKFYTRPIAQLTAILNRERQQQAIHNLLNTCNIS
ncbi:unnamed protein product, partial [Rotaria socialis]